MVRTSKGFKLFLCVKTARGEGRDKRKHARAKPHFSGSVPAEISPRQSFFVMLLLLLLASTVVHAAHQGTLLKLQFSVAFYVRDLIWIFCCLPRSISG
jgi:hypothetical protein